MNPVRNTISLLVVLAVLLVLTAASHIFESRPDTSHSKITGAIFPELDVNALTRIVMSKGEGTITLSRDGQGWKVLEQFGYPANVLQVEQLLEALRRYNDADIFSDKPGVQAEFNCTADSGVIVNLFSGEKKVADFIAGKTAFTPVTSYIRKADDNRILEVYGNSSKLYSTNPALWIKTKLFELKATDISSLKVKGQGNEYELANDNGAWKFSDGSTEVPHARFVQQIIYYLTAVSLKEVVQSGNEQLVDKGLDPPEWEYEFTTVGGETFILSIGKKKDGATYYAKANLTEFVVSIPGTIAETLMATRDNVIKGATAAATVQQPKAPKQPHPTKYKVIGKGQPLPQVIITTNKGDILVELWEDDAPNTVANFIYLVEKGFYDGLLFHRFKPNVVLQGGDPLGNGQGGPGWSVESEVSARKYDFGVLGMADSGVDTGGSQFFFAFTPMPQWDPRYTNFGKIIKGEDVFKMLGKGDNIVRMVVVSKREHEYRPFVTKDGSKAEEQLPALKPKPKKQLPPPPAK